MKKLFLVALIVAVAQAGFSLTTSTKKAESVLKDRHAQIEAAVDGDQ